MKDHGCSSCQILWDGDKNGRLCPECGREPTHEPESKANAAKAMKDPTQCPHENTVEETTGGYHFDHVHGVTDDIERHSTCLDCGADVTPAAADLPNVSDAEPLPF